MSGDTVERRFVYASEKDWRRNNVVQSVAGGGVPCHACITSTYQGVLHDDVGKIRKQVGGRTHGLGHAHGWRNFRLIVDLRDLCQTRTRLCEIWMNMVVFVRRERVRIVRWARVCRSVSNVVCEWMGVEDEMIPASRYLQLARWTSFVILNINTTKSK